MAAMMARFVSFFRGDAANAADFSSHPRRSPPLPLPCSLSPLSV